MTSSPQYKQLRRSPSDKMIAGVLSGVARYFGIDPVVARIAFILGVFLTGGALLIAYLIMWIVMPEDQPAPVYPTPTSYPPPAA